METAEPGDEHDVVQQGLHLKGRAVSSTCLLPLFIMSTESVRGEGVVTLVRGARAEDRSSSLPYGLAAG